MKTFSKTDVGRKRETNQDYVYARTKPVGKLPNLFAVADGMGGHNAGDRASKCTVEILEREIEESTETNIKDIIRQAIYKANEKIIEMAERDSKLEGMGTTLVVATIVHNMIYFANVGDSRLYLINHTITQLTKDHSLVEEMVRLGGIKPEEARNHPDKNIITRAIGAKEGVEPDFFEHSLKKGDIILMCSDGLSNMIEDEEIFQIVKSGRDVVEITEDLIETANENGGKDNIGVVVIEQIAAEQNIRIVWEKKEIKHRDLIGSPRYVKRVMMNILSNAVKYNRENGQIYISCREIPSEQPEMTIMEFVCRDTGIGMTDEFQKHIFEPFAQEHTGSRTKFAGTGLGMPIAKKLVEKMGGTITFESEKGVGTTFVIRVPFKIDPNADKREEQKEVSEKSIKGLHILLAEDNELNMEIAEFMLQNEGADVSKAWNGQEAVELFRNSEPGEFDVILMDIMMPVMDGYEAAKMIRSLDREDAKEIPIIAMTANAFTEDRIKAKEAGMDEHIAKPVDMELLIKVIHKLVK